MGPRVSISSGQPSSVRSKNSSTISNGDDIIDSFNARRQLSSPFQSNPSGKIERGTEQRKSGKSVTISLKDGEDEMMKSIIQERPLPELPISRYISICDLLTFLRQIRFLLFRQKKLSSTQYIYLSNKFYLQS